MVLCPPMIGSEKKILRTTRASMELGISAEVANEYSHPPLLLSLVLQQLYPNLDLALDRLLDIYIQLTGDKHHTVPIDSTEAENMPATEGLKIFDKRPSLEGRGLSLRDLLKWSNRIAYSFDGSSSSTAVNIFHEALDCFTAMLSAPAARLKMAEVIGSKLNISKQKAEFFCELYKPEITVRELDVSVGRVEMLRRQTESIRVHREKINFAATRPSSILIEQIAVCVNKAEPVLLVGETGTGKTSTVQYLAHVAGPRHLLYSLIRIPPTAAAVSSASSALTFRQRAVHTNRFTTPSDLSVTAENAEDTAAPPMGRETGQRLRIVNMNQQSDTADLLGGFILLCRQVGFDIEPFYFQIKNGYVKRPME
ncbi:unnamed protein product [Ranitomeya imitator]|uniref:Midasin AAA lid domain-containing protein n=1 Tax=Ranitomeya imitator TaxID=111125 RepID=A0ABN9MGV2_9NEOB|nr:unnamed protein product [Ranitomeya imitator]